MIFLRGTTRIGPPQRYGKPAFPAVTYRGHASGYCGSPASLPRRGCAVRTSSRSSGCGALNLWLPLSSPRRADQEGSRILTPRDCYSILAPALCQGGRAPFDRMGFSVNAILSVPGAGLYPPPPHCQGGRAPFDRMGFSVNATLPVPGAWLYPMPTLCQEGGCRPFDRFVCSVNATLPVPGAWLYPMPTLCQEGGCRPFNRIVCSVNANFQFPWQGFTHTRFYLSGAFALLTALSVQSMQFSRFPEQGFTCRRPNNFLSSRAQAQP